MLLLVPMMIVVMVFPMVTGFVVANYNNEQRLLAVEQASAKIGSSIQQVYLILSEENVKDCKVILDNPLPADLEGQQYIITGTFEGDCLTLHIGLPGINVWHNHKVTLGENAAWISSSLNSNLPTTSIIGIKEAGKITLGFG